MISSIFSFFKKPLSTVSDEITTKFKTPLITAYIIIWVIKNNLFLYDLFFNKFKPNKTYILKENLNLSSWQFYQNLLITFLISVLILIFFYFFLNISRVITIFSEERLKLNLLQKLKSKSISAIDDVDFWKNKFTSLNKDNEKLSDDNTSLRSSLSYSQKTLEDERNSIKKINKQQNEAISRIKEEVVKFANNEVYNNLQSLKLKETILEEVKKYENQNKNAPGFLRLS